MSKKLQEIVNNDFNKFYFCEDKSLFYFTPLITCNIERQIIYFTGRTLKSEYRTMCLENPQKMLEYFKFFLIKKYDEYIEEPHWIMTYAESFVDYDGIVYMSKGER